MWKEDVALKAIWREACLLEAVIAAGGGSVSRAGYVEVVTISQGYQLQNTCIMYAYMFSFVFIVF
jgi:hypothetical protein